MNILTKEKCVHRNLKHQRSASNIGKTHIKRLKQVSQRMRRIHKECQGQALVTKKKYCSMQCRESIIPNSIVNNTSPVKESIDNTNQVSSKFSINLHSLNHTEQNEEEKIPYICPGSVKEINKSSISNSYIKDGLFKITNQYESFEVSMTKPKKEFKKTKLDQKVICDTPPSIQETPTHSKIRSQRTLDFKSNQSHCKQAKVYHTSSQIGESSSRISTKDNLHKRLKKHLGYFGGNIKTRLLGSSSYTKSNIADSSVKTPHVNHFGPEKFKSPRSSKQKRKMRNYNTTKKKVLLLPDYTSESSLLVRTLNKKRKMKNLK
ncbi:unnamed protein product [Moneuplotes crassus]|uniref:Uncharacterized protein n=1 Tax=Euplotes crassus TaxID=5936 RepID=A0AAD1XZK0_EUPCR|nr:unnamed protein product [Moneuplotes crassus]